jgi:hypothetical protein
VGAEFGSVFGRRKGLDEVDKGVGDVDSGWVLVFSSSVGLLDLSHVPNVCDKKRSMRVSFDQEAKKPKGRGRTEDDASELYPDLLPIISGRSRLSISVQAGQERMEKRSDSKREGRSREDRSKREASPRMVPIYASSDHSLERGRAGEVDLIGLQVDELDGGSDLVLSSRGRRRVRGELVRVGASTVLLRWRWHGGVAVGLGGGISACCR